MSFEVLSNAFRSVPMRNNFGEFESGLAVLLVHVQKRRERVASTTTETVQETMQKLKDFERKKKELTYSGKELNSDEQLEVRKIEERIEQASTKLKDLMNTKTEETKSRTQDAPKPKLLDDDDDEQPKTRITSTPFNFEQDFYPAHST